MEGSSDSTAGTLCIYTTSPLSNGSLPHDMTTTDSLVTEAPTTERASKRHTMPESLRPMHEQDRHSTTGVLETKPRPVDSEGLERRRVSQAQHMQRHQHDTLPPARPYTP